MKCTVIKNVRVLLIITISIHDTGFRIQGNRKKFLITRVLLFINTAFAFMKYSVYIYEMHTSINDTGFGIYGKRFKVLSPSRVAPLQEFHEFSILNTSHAFLLNGDYFDIYSK